MDGRHIADDLVAKDQRGLGAGMGAVEDAQVGASQAHLRNPNQRLAGTDLGNWDIDHLDGIDAGPNCSSHRWHGPSFIRACRVPARLRL